MSRVLVGSWLLLSAGAVAEDGPGIDFFEKRVRPILAENCWECHGRKKQEAGLRLDSAEAFKNGSDSGPIIAPGHLDASLLLDVVSYAGSTRMPPKGKLPDQHLDVLKTWVRMGAPWPAEPASRAPSNKDRSREAKTHWAFQPVRKQAPPRVNNPQWLQTPVDAFLLAKLETNGLEPSLRADRRTLIRRATFDLHGLPPTPAEVADFENDPSPVAFERLLDRLLASPRYGERWGRHWLDVARYSNTKGYVRLKDNPLYPSAWTYRDYVIRAFNDDLPYDRFIVEQLAADQLDLGDDLSPLAAMGFLTLGQRFLNSQHDIIDDRIDVTTRGLLGLTVACARCHDHKFDPVPTKDYYSLHGVFASSIEPRVAPLASSRSDWTRYSAYLAELERRKEKLHQFLAMQQAKLQAASRTRVAEYLFAGQHEEVQPNFLAVMFLIDATKDLNPVMTQRWARYLEQSRKKHDPVLAPWHALARLAPAEFEAKARDLIADWLNGGSTHDPRRWNLVVVNALADAPPRNLHETAERYRAVLRQADERWHFARQADPAATQLDDSEWEELRLLLHGPESPTVVALEDVEEFLFVDTTTQNELHDHQRLVEDWIAAPGAAPHAHVLFDAARPTTPRVFLRGNASNPGESVPRQFLEALSSGSRRPFQTGSGRLELAQAIASRDNPLTARVLVNRVWAHHFGAGLVRTPSDFGLRGEPPTHPELLDYLAGRFIDEGWSIKRLHRAIMLSATYQQASEPEPGARAVAVDPENRLLSRMNRRRLDWEPLRDSLLSVAGELDLTMGGPSARLTTTPFSRRRAVYGYIDRQEMPGVMRTFDFPPPDTSSPGRHQTTVPQQALFLMNSPFLKEQSRRLGARNDLTRIERIGERIDVVHRLLFARAAEPHEIALGEQFLKSGPQDVPQNSEHLTPWEQYVQTLLLSNEFVFVD